MSINFLMVMIKSRGCLIACAVILRKSCVYSWDEIIVVLSRAQLDSMGHSSVLRILTKFCWIFMSFRTFSEWRETLFTRDLTYLKIPR